MKKEYKTVVNESISLLEHNFENKNKKQIIGMVYDYIKDNNLITDFRKTSLYNTIYYFLRKRNIFKSEEINFRFDSISSKIKFVKLFRDDLDCRWWFYHDLFFGEIERPVLAADTKVIIGKLNYIIDSKIDNRFDCLYTMLYFREVRKLINADSSSICVKRELNEKLYDIFNTLYSFDEYIKNMVNDLSPESRKKLIEHSTQFFGYLSEFNPNDYDKFYSDMIKNVNKLRFALKKSKYADIFNFNNGRFFDSITFNMLIHLGVLKYSTEFNKYNDFNNIHFMIQSAMFYVFFKFSKRLKKNHFIKMENFFDSDIYFSCTKYVVEYYNVFYKEVFSLLESGGFDAKETLFKFDIILRYMLYNKFRNLINSNMKRFLSINFDVSDHSFMDVDDVNDAVLYGCNLYYQSEPVEESVMKTCGDVCNKFFNENSISNRDDVTSAAFDIYTGNIVEGKYKDDVVKLGNKLVDLLLENSI